MVSLDIEATFSSEASQTLKELEGLKSDGIELEERIATLEDGGYSVSITSSSGELTFSVTESA